MKTLWTKTSFALPNPVNEHGDSRIAVRELRKSLVWKKIMLLCTMIFPLFLTATNYVSVKTGKWSDPNTWGGSGFPNAATDNAVISTGNIVTANDYQEVVNNLTVNGSMVVQSVYFAIEGELINNGNISGSMPISIWGNGTALDGKGTWIAFNSAIRFRGSNQIIAATCVDSMPNASVVFHPVLASASRVTNLGKVVAKDIYAYNTSIPATWVNGTNSYLFLTNSSLTAPNDTLYANAPGNTILWGGKASYSIKQPVGNTYYNLSVSNTGVKTLIFDPNILNNLTLYPAVAFNTAGHSFIIGGNWINNIVTGSVMNFTGTVIFNGTLPQTIGGTHSTRFANITISGKGGVSLVTNSAFTGVMTLSGNGILSGPAEDTLVSTASATARVAQINGKASITASFVVQRYNGRTVVQNEALSSPVQSTTLGDWTFSNRTPPFWMKGVGGPDGDSGTFVSVKIYNEVTNVYDNVTNYATPGINYILPQGKGIYVWMGHSISSMYPFTYITHGVPTVGDVNYNVTYTSGKGNGFNIIGNPYPSPISWTSVKNGNHSLQNSYYLFEQDGSWHTFTSGNITMGQGFGVVTTSAATLTFKENYKSNTDASLQRISDPGEEPNAALFVLSNNANTYSCPTIISFGESYVPNYNSEEDAIFISSYIKEVPQLYTAGTDNTYMALNRLPDAENTMEVPLIAIGNVAADYTLSAKNIGNISSYNSVTLLDKNTGEVLNNFKENPDYTFSISRAGEERDFILQFSKNAVVASVSDMAGSGDGMQIYSSATGATINFHMAQPVDAIISVYSAMGQKVVADIHANVYQEQLNVALPGSVQIYIVKVQTPNGVTVKKLFRQNLGY